MKIKTLTTIASLLMLMFIAGCATSSNSSATAPSGSLSVKAGDALYVCPCASTCECDVVALKPAKCGCGHDLVKVTVTEVKGQDAHYKVEGKDQTAKLTGKYACACGGECCQLISNKPGKCACGKALVKVGK
jgi:hypothetical protein